jgi:hypothetical protein
MSGKVSNAGLDPGELRERLRELRKRFEEFRGRL